jgi:4a-hydroxytetrahydrobiopterin dehydratase
VTLIPGKAPMNSVGEIASAAKADTYAPVKLSPAQIQAELATVPGWNVVGNALVREITTKGYKKALETAALIGGIPNKEFPHFPEVAFKFGSVTVSVWTHDVNGISNLDFEFARRANQLLAS